MNRQERLRREMPAELQHRAAELATLPVAQVDLIIAGFRLSRREGRKVEAEARKRRNEGRSDGPGLASAAGRLTARAARRATPETLARLAEHYDEGPAVLQVVVDGLRAASPRPFSWAEIGSALGITRQSAWERFGRQGDPDTPEAGTERGDGRLWAQHSTGW